MSLATAQVAVLVDLRADPAGIRSRTWRGDWRQASEEALGHAHPGHIRAMSEPTPNWHGTTILAVRKGASTVIAGDGQVSMGPTIVKGNAKKVRRLAGGKVLAGFAGATADAFTLIERLEAKLEQYPDSLGPRLRRPGQGLAHRPLPAPPGGHADRRRRSSIVTGVGDVLEPEYGVAAIGSGGRLRWPRPAR